MFDHGGDINKGQLIHHAVQREIDATEILELLFQKGATVNSVLYANHEQSWNAQFFLGLGTVLHEAVSRKSPSLVTYLIDKGVDISIANSRGQTALDLAVANNDPEIAYLLRRSSRL